MTDSNTTSSDNQFLMTPEHKNTKFKKGQVANPFGRTLGSRNKSSMLAESLMREDLEGIVQKVCEQAKEGCTASAKLILDKLLPNAKEKLAPFQLPQIKTFDDIITATNLIIDAVTRGEISAADANHLTGMITKIKELHIERDYEERILKMELALEKKPAR